MVFVYIVRCNFIAPDQEAAWNNWYSGPKIAQMLAKPLFQSCQRFHRVTGNWRNYLALWALQSPQALKTPEYTAQWGFAEWSSHITDWSRDLFDGGDAAATDFAVPPDGALQVASFDGVAAEAARPMIANVDLTWLPVIGLDRHTPLIGLRALAFAATASPLNGSSFVENAIYRPISDFIVARGGAPPATKPRS